MTDSNQYDDDDLEYPQDDWEMIGCPGCSELLQPEDEIIGLCAVCQDEHEEAFNNDKDRQS